MEQNGSPRTAAAIHRTGGTLASPPAITPRPRPGMAVRTAARADRVALESGETISLTQPRPSVSRARNEYIETPLRGGLRPSHSTSTPLHESTHIYLSGPSPSLKRHHSTRRSSVPVTKQPGSAASSFAKGVAPASAASSFAKEIAPASGECVVPRETIICPQCDKCRCEACRTPRPLPQKWLCADKCLCSADATVDYLSCLCCVKGAFYHCAPEDEDSSSCADRPCSCGPSHRLARWTCLASLSLVLPCLWCYWPLKGCVKAVETLHRQCHRRGCRCPASPQLTPAPSVVVASKRLLDNH